MYDAVVRGGRLAPPWVLGAVRRRVAGPADAATAAAAADADREEGFVRRSDGEHAAEVCTSSMKNVN